MYVYIFRCCIIRLLIHYSHGINLRTSQTTTPLEGVLERDVVELEDAAI